MRLIDLSVSWQGRVCSHSREISFARQLFSNPLNPNRREPLHCHVQLLQGQIGSMQWWADSRQQTADSRCINIVMGTSRQHQYTSHLPSSSLVAYTIFSPEVRSGKSSQSRRKLLDGQEMVLGIIMTIISRWEIRSKYVLVFE